MLEPSLVAKEMTHLQAHFRVRAYSKFLSEKT